MIQALNLGADFYLQKGGDSEAQYTELAFEIPEAVEQRRAENHIRINDQRLRKAHEMGKTGNLLTNAGVTPTPPACP